MVRFYFVSGTVHPIQCEKDFNYFFLVWGIIPREGVTLDEQTGNEGK
jgi:hypothetical protein